MRRLLLTAFALFTLSGCQNAYFNTMESVGIDKREMFVHRVEDARGAEDKARQQLRDTLDNYRRVVMLDGSDLLQRYQLFSGAQEGNNNSLRAIHQRIENLSDVGEAMFADWKDDLDGYSDKGLRDASAAQMDNTRDTYEKVLQQLRSSEKSLKTTLALFNDPQLALRNSLNASAIAPLKAGYPALQASVEAQLRDMQLAVDQCDAFLRQLQATQPG